MGVASRGHEVEERVQLTTKYRPTKDPVEEPRSTVSGNEGGVGQVV